MSIIRLETFRWSLPASVFNEAVTAVDASRLFSQICSIFYRLKKFSYRIMLFLAGFIISVSDQNIPSIHRRDL